MNTFQNQSLVLLSCLLLAGCTSTNAPKETIMPQMQQNTYLSHARPPQQFGFAVYPLADGIAYSGKCRLHPNHLAGVKMIDNDIPVIKMRGRSKHQSMNALIDFSSPASWMEFSTSQDFDAHFMGINDVVIPYRGGYNTGGVNAFAGVVTQLRIDNLFMENIPFYIRMASGSIGPLARGIISPKVDAVLGYDNLRNFEYIQIDLRNKTIKFSSTIPYVPHKELLVDTVKIVSVLDYGLTIEGAVDDEPTAVLLDFAGNYDFARGDVKVSTTNKIVLGHLSFRQTPTLVLPINASPPRAGRKMLSPYLITISNGEGVVYFERLPEED